MWWSLGGKMKEQNPFQFCKSDWQKQMEPCPTSDKTIISIARTFQDIWTVQFYLFYFIFFFPAPRRVSCGLWTCLALFTNSSFWTGRRISYFYLFIYLHCIALHCIALCFIPLGLKNTFILPISGNCYYGNLLL